MRWIRFIGKLNEVLTNVGVDLLVFEAARNSRFGNATRVAGGFQSQVERWCAENKIEYRAYGPSEIKKHATGNGRASKEEMIDAAERKFKRVIESDNEADALMLLDLAKADYGA